MRQLLWSGCRTPITVEKTMSTPVIDAMDRAVLTYLPEVTDLERRREITTMLRRTATTSVTPSPHRVVVGPHTPQDRDEKLALWACSLVEEWARDVFTEADLTVVTDETQFRSDATRSAASAVEIILLRAALEMLHHLRSHGRLSGATQEARFDQFRTWLGSAAGSLEFHERFAESLAWASHLVINHVRHLTEVLTRWENDRPTVAEALPGISANDRITRLVPGLGDPHHHGRSVTIVHFSGGGQVVYKPRSLAIDGAYEAIVEVVNAGAGTQLRAAKSVDRGSWGWSEFIDCTKTGSTAPTYRRDLGHLTGLLHLLGSTDVHFENVITDSLGRPVLIDAETLLSPAPRKTPAYDAGAASSIARNVVEKSVIGIGTLPLVVEVPGRDAKLDIGVAGGLAVGQRQPYGSLLVRNAGRDDMHLDLVHSVTTSGNENPGVAGLGLEEVHQYRDEVREGVAHVLEWAYAHRDLLTNLFVRELSGTRLRYVHCPTMFYVQLLRMQTHPTTLADVEARLAILGRVHLRDSGETAALCDAEIAQMLNGDVPLFAFSPDSSDLSDADTNVVSQNFFARAPLDDVLARLSDLTPERINDQLDMVDLAFVPVLPDGGEQTPTEWTATQSEAVIPHVCPDDVRSALVDMTRRHVRSTDDRHPATWYGPQVTASDSSQWAPGVLGYDVYGGSIGIAFAMAAARHLHHFPEYDEIINGVTNAVERQIVGTELDDHHLSVGGMTGMGGTVWALDAIHHLRDEPNPHYAKMISALARHTQSSGPAEFTTGAAGALASALALVRRSGVENPAHTESLLTSVLSPVLREADHVLATGQMSESGTSAFTGYAHGLAGLVTPLFEAAELLDDPSISQRAQDLVYLLFQCRAERGQWPRQLDGNSTSYAWCHGAPGLLLGLTTAHRHCPDISSQVLTDLVVESLQEGLGNNPSLCHGDLGTLDVVLEHARLHQHEDLAAQAAGLLSQAAQRQIAAPRRESRSRYQHVDSLMVGRAGALYAIARANDPSVPCALGLR